MRNTTAASTKEKLERKKPVESRNVQTNETSTKSKFSSKRNSSNNRKPVICKQCHIEFADISKRNAHHCNGDARYYMCDQCDSKFKVKENFVVHRQTKHSTAVVVRKKVAMKSKKETHHGVGVMQMEINANNQELGEFVIDALYMHNNQLKCRARNLECFVTNNALAMKAHREKYHMRLEQRISYLKWRDLIPNSFLNEEFSENEEMKNDGNGKSRDASTDVKSFALNGDEETAQGESQAAISKNFGDYLKKLRQRYAGV